MATADVLFTCLVDSVEVFPLSAGQGSHQLLMNQKLSDEMGEEMKEGSIGAGFGVGWPVPTPRNHCGSGTCGKLT